MTTTRSPFQRARMIVGTEVICPWHGVVFDITTGSVVGPPAPRDIARYTVRVNGQDIEVEVEL